MTKILFTGATGLLGKYFIAKKPPKYRLFGTFYKNSTISENNFYKLDIADRNAVLTLFKNIKPDIVVHAASLGNVDYCESHKNEAHTVNVIGTQNVLYACRIIGAKIIFTSTNAVYDGKKAPYSEKSPVKPLDEYGKTKAEGEKLVLKSKVSYIILRLMTMYGWPQKGGRNNPVGWIIEELENKRKLNVVSDIYNNYLYAGQAAEVIWKIIQKNKKNEIYNIAGSECINRFELALKVAKVFNLDPSLMMPVKSTFFKGLAPRPKNTCFDTKKIERVFKFKLHSVAEGLKKMKDEQEA